MQSLILVLTLLSTTIQVSPPKTLPSNKHFWSSDTTVAAPQQIWEIWMDVPNWKNWDTGLQDAASEEALQLGTKGVITTLEGRKAKFEVVEFVEGKSYTYKTKLPLGALYVKRYLHEESGGTVFTHEVWFSGITKGIFANAFGGTFREMLPAVLANICRLAE